MSYYIDDHTMTLIDLSDRLKATDLIPSQHVLLEDITKKMNALKKAGITSIADLRKQLKSKKLITSLADTSGITYEYLNVLRRTIEGFFPKPQPLTIFDWIPETTINKLSNITITNTKQLYEATVASIAQVTKKTGIDKLDLTELVALSDLSRIQWVSPTFARTIIAAGFVNAKQVSHAEPEILYQAILQANNSGHYYKGKVGLRDIKRLTVAAGYVP